MIDVKGLSGGRIMSYNHHITLTNSFIISSYMCIEVFSKGLGSPFTILNSYIGPYEKKKSIWDNLLNLHSLNNNNFIMGGI